MYRKEVRTRETLRTNNRTLQIAQIKRKMKDRFKVKIEHFICDNIDSIVDNEITVSEFILNHNSFISISRSFINYIKSNYNYKIIDYRHKASV